MFSFLWEEKSYFSHVLISLILKENAGRRQTKSDGPIAQHSENVDFCE